MLALGTAAVSAQDPPAAPPPEAGQAGTADTKPEGIAAWLRRRARAFSGAPDDRPDGITGTLGVVIAGSALGVNVGYRKASLLDTGIGVEADAMVTLRRYQSYRAAVGFLGARRSTASMQSPDTRMVSLFNDSAPKAPGSALYADIRFRDYPRHMYFGRGIGTIREDRADYALTGLSYEAVYQRQVHRTFGMVVRAGVVDLAVGTGRDDSVVNVEDRFGPDQTPGAVEHPRFVTLGAGLIYDTRANPLAPDTGAFVALAVRRFRERDPSLLGFTRTTVDARTYVRTGALGVVAVRALVSGDATDPGGATPFYLQESLGGGETLRGFRPFRFQERALAHGTVEYRWRAHRFLDVAPFVDAGTVGPGLAELTGTWRFSGGVGLRARTADHVLFRLDWARSGDGHRVILSTGPFF